MRVELKTKTKTYLSIDLWTLVLLSFTNAHIKIPEHLLKLPKRIKLYVDGKEIPK